MNIVTEIVVGNPIWNEYTDLINEDFFNNITRKILALYPHLSKNTEVELSVLLSNDEQIKLLNKEFRSKNTPTNVLSFPEYEDKLFKTLDFIAPNNYLYLGDIVFSFETIKNESHDGGITPPRKLANEEQVQGAYGAQNRNVHEDLSTKSAKQLSSVVDFMNHFTHLTIHSILHLLGHDHIEENDAKIMEDLEIKLLASFQIKSPYIQN